MPRLLEQADLRWIDDQKGERDILPQLCWSASVIAMHRHYEDILSRIADPPTWFDDGGVPRFGEFSPLHLGNIYASEAALAEVSCQNCGRVFHVALTEAFASSRFSLGDEIRLARVHYGDPPNVWCCSSGPSMKSVMHKIIEYWIRDYERSSDWQREAAFEGPVSKVPLDPPDTTAEVFAAIGEGVRRIRVQCTSHRNRYDITGRVAATQARNGRVLVAYPRNYVVVARGMLKDLVPEIDVGIWKDDRTITMADFSDFASEQLASIDQIIVLAPPFSRRESTKELQNDAAAHLATKAGSKVIVEFALAHSHCVVTNPELVISGG